MAHATLPKDQADEVILRAHDKVLEAMVNSEAIMTEEVHKELIENVMAAAMTSVLGMANVDRPQLLHKETTRTINGILHQWKDYVDPHIHSTLGLRRRFSEAHSTSSTPKQVQSLRTERVNNLLDNFDYLREAPTCPLFSAHYFQDLVIDHLYTHTPILWKFIDHSAPHTALDNLFALGAAAVAASIHEYQEGRRHRHEVSPAIWRADYYKVQEQIKQIREDECERSRLDHLQQWVLEQRDVELDQLG
jgi:hypothetical protein